MPAVEEGRESEEVDSGRPSGPTAAKVQAKKETKMTELEHIMQKEQLVCYHIDADRFAIHNVTLSLSLSLPSPPPLLDRFVMNMSKAVC